MGKGTAFRAVVLIVGGGALLVVGVLLVNQTAQVVQLASTIHPSVGTATLWSLVASAPPGLKTEQNLEGEIGE